MNGVSVYVYIYINVCVCVCVDGSREVAVTCCLVRSPVTTETLAENLTNGGCRVDGESA